MRDKKYFQHIICELTSDPEEAALIMAFVECESAWDSDARRFEKGYFNRYIKGKKWQKEAEGWFGEFGEGKEYATSYSLMQVMIPTAIQYGLEGDPREIIYPISNLYWGMQIVRALREKYQTLPLAISAYNAGSPSEKNRKYVQRVILAFERYYEEQKGE